MFIYPIPYKPFDTGNSKLVVMGRDYHRLLAKASFSTLHANQQSQVFGKTNSI